MLKIITKQMGIARGQGVDKTSVRERGRIESNKIIFVSADRADGR